MLTPSGLCSDCGSEVKKEPHSEWCSELKWEAGYAKGKEDARKNFVATLDEIVCRVQFSTSEDRIRLYHQLHKAGLL